MRVCRGAAGLQPGADRADGRVLLGGDTLAAGYLGRPDLTAAVFFRDGEGRRWFRTDDLGHLGRTAGSWWTAGPTT